MEENPYKSPEKDDAPSKIDCRGIVASVAITLVAGLLFLGAMPLVLVAIFGIGDGSYEAIAVGGLSSLALMATAELLIKQALGLIR